MQTSYVRHDHREWHRYRSRLCARQHGRDHRVPVGRVRDRMVHRSAARAPLRTARRRVTYRAALTSGPESPATGTSSGAREAAMAAFELAKGMNFQSTASDADVDDGASSRGRRYRPCDGDPRRVGAVAKRPEGSPERLRRDRRLGRDSGAQRQPSHAPLINDCARSNKSRQKRPSDL
jgi:hypothetical protein